MQSDKPAHDSPYAKFQHSELILRDQLALDRTVIANERTLLSYVRTAFALVVAGVSFLQFFDSRLVEMIGLMFIPAGLVVLALGWRSYQKLRSDLRGIATGGVFKRRQASS